MLNFPRTIIFLSYYAIAARKLAAIAVVAAGYGGDMDEELCNELLDDMNFHYNNVKCRKTEEMLPKLMKMVEGRGEAFLSGKTTEHGDYKERS